MHSRSLLRALRAPVAQSRALSTADLFQNISRLPFPQLLKPSATDVSQIVPNEATLSRVMANHKMRTTAGQVLALARSFIAAHGSPQSTDAQLSKWRGSVMSEFANDVEEMCTVSRLLGMVSRDKSMGLALLKVAAECGHQDAAHNYGLQLVRGNVTLADRDGAKVGFGIVKVLSDLGHGMSQVVIGETMLTSKKHDMRMRGIAMLERAADHTPVASFKLGETYRKTDVVPRDIDLARKWHIRAAKAGLAESYFVLGNMLSSGEGVRGKTPDFAGALKMFELGAVAGNAESAYNVGMYNLLGTGTEKNIDLAIEYLMLASSKRFPIAMLNLGKIFMEGSEVPRDLRRGRSYLNTAKELSGEDGFIRKQADLVLDKYSHINETQCIIM